MDSGGETPQVGVQLSSLQTFGKAQPLQKWRTNLIIASEKNESIELGEGSAFRRLSGGVALSCPKPIRGASRGR